MVKKIVALAISLVLSIGSLVAYNAINTDAVEFGEGSGVSRTIKSVSELSDVLSKIPSFEEYSENADISAAEGRTGFEGVTVVETGYVSEYSNYERAITHLPNAVPDGETIYKSRDQELKNHRLEMSFAKNAVYYHSIGTMWSATEYYTDILPEEGARYSYNFYHDDFVVAYREMTNYDVEIYHSNDKTMFKINKYDTVTQRATKIKNTEIFYENYAEESEGEDDDDAMTQLTNDLIDEMLKIREQNYGSWIEYPADDGEGEATEPDFEGVENMTPEQQKEFMINMMVQEFANQLTLVAYQDLLTVQAAHASNKNYLNGIAGYIVAHSTDADYFTKTGNAYKLVSEPKWIPAVWEDDVLVSEGYSDYTTIDSYLNAVGLPSYRGDNRGQNVKFDFTIGEDVVTLKQKVNNWTEYNSNTYDTTTVVMYIDNTVVNLSNSAKIKSLDDAYVTPFEKVLTKKINSMYDQLMGGNE